MSRSPTLSNLRFAGRSEVRSRRFERAVRAVWTRREWVLLGAILVFAVFLRLYRLQAVPPGLTHDEAANGQSALQVLGGSYPLYFTIANGREPLYAYSMAPLVALMGPTVTAIRLTSVLWSLALILLTWAWARDAFGSGIALLSAAGLSVGYWPLMLSRLGLRAITLPVLFVASVLVLWRTLQRRWESRPISRRAQWGGYGAAGVLLGLSFYTYMASRALPAILVLFLAYLALFHRRKAGATWRGILLVLLIAGLMVLPLWHYLGSHPGAETRIEQLDQPLRQAQSGDWWPLQKNVLDAFKMFVFDGAGDPHWIYNISGHPLMDPVSGVLFFAGLLLALWRWRDPGYYLLSVWFVVGMAPVVVTGVNSSTVRAVAAQPAVFVLQAVALYGLSATLGRFLRHGTGYLVPAAVLLAVAAVSATTFFVRWPNERDVRVAYHTSLVEIAHSLDRLPQGATAAISTIYPGVFHDPYAFDFVTRRQDLLDRWFDGRSALLFPDVDQAYAVFPALAPLDPALESLFVPWAQLHERVELRPDDLSPWFEVYRWRPRKARQQLPMMDPIDVGHVVAFQGYDLRTPVVHPGGVVELITFWRVLDVSSLRQDQELVLFSHVLGAGQEIVGQQDRLDVPAWNWRPGDVLAQLHRFALADGIPDGRYTVEVGAYTRVPGYPRLQVFGPGSETSDAITLAPVEVRSP
jgi:4-amino-4-deoxy-L-arabinose transferase-like glycosyltransferase